MSFDKRYKLALEEFPPADAKTEDEDQDTNDQPASEPDSEPASEPSSQPDSNETSVSESATPSEPVTTDTPASEPVSQPTSPVGYTPDPNLNSATIIISAFPGCGKSQFCREHDDSKDLESSLYSKTIDGKNNPDFPRNYIEQLKFNLSNLNWKYIFVSSHKLVREELDREKIRYFTIYPAPTRKEEFKANYKQRGNTDTFINLIDENWDTWINEMKEISKSYELQPGEFINDDLFNGNLKFLKQ